MANEFLARLGSVPADGTYNVTVTAGIPSFTTDTGGSVIPNPTTTATDTLNTVSIAGTTYNFPSVAQAPTEMDLPQPDTSTNGQTVLLREGWENVIINNLPFDAGPVEDIYYGFLMQTRVLGGVTSRYFSFDHGHNYFLLGSMELGGLTFHDTDPITNRTFAFGGQVRTLPTAGTDLTFEDNDGTTKTITNTTRIAFPNAGSAKPDWLTYLSLNLLPKDFLL